MTVMAIMGVVLGALTTVFVSGSKAEYDMNVRFQAQQQARLALDRVRRDIHIAGCVTLGTNGTNVQLLSVTSTSTCPGTIFAYYCATTSPTQSSQYALYRGTAVLSTCNTGTLIADHLTTNQNVFSYTASTGQQLQKITVDVVVDADPNATGGKYELKDGIVLRNSVRS
jgi:hypothetical protein